MEARILELLHRPENIAKEDIALLQKEISKYPYVQSIRTLQLSAVHLFDVENYHKELTKTAAFTTDKKILYQFINKKKIEEKKESIKFKKINFKSEEPQTVTSEPVFIVENKEEKLISETEAELSLKEKIEFSENAETVNTSEEIEPVIVENPVVAHLNSVVGDTELETPIVDEKENEFEVIRELETLEEVLPFESEKEPDENLIFKTRKEDLNYSKETVLEQIDQISETEKSTVKPSEISFNTFDSFLPNVKFAVPAAKLEPLNMPEASGIEEIVSSEEIQNEILVEDQTEIIEEKLEDNIAISDIKAVIPMEIESAEETQKEIVEKPEEIHFEWKPMNFIQHTLDSQIKKQNTESPKPVAEIDVNKSVISEVSQVKNEENNQKIEVLIEKSENIEAVEDITTEDIEKERPLLNMSFFSNKAEAAIEEREEITEPQQEAITDNSNVPNFVNTWQSWLKIDRPENAEEVATPEKVIEKKAEIIDKFIEESPRISQLKEEVSFVVKEKTDDISHLMTETLAKLYVEQRLYAKAMKAYDVLQNKYPEKAEYFKTKIQEIRELKQNK